MLALWMFGTELERTWGTRFFTKYYFVTGVGAALTTLLLVDRPLHSPTRCTTRVTVGASGAVYGVLLAYAHVLSRIGRSTVFIFPIPARYFVMIIGAIAFLSSIGGGGSGVAHTAHLGGLVVGYLYLKGLRGAAARRAQVPLAAVEDEPRARPFDVYSGGRATTTAGRATGRSTFTSAARLRVAYDESLAAMAQPQRGALDGAPPPAPHDPW